MFLEGRIKILGEVFDFFFFRFANFCALRRAREVEKWGRNAGGNFLTLEMCTSGAWRGGEGGRCAATGCGSGGWAL